jgi:hypothetical protein
LELPPYSQIDIKGMLTLFSILILSIAINSLKITSIYFGVNTRKWIAVYLLLIAGVLVVLLLLGSGYGGMSGLFQATSPLQVMEEIETFPVDVSVFYGSAYEKPLMFYDILANKSLIYTLLAGKAGVYIILNIVNGKYYIGSAINLTNRIKKHITGQSSNKHLQNAINLYGLQNFALIILDICDPNKKVLLELEQLALDLWKPAYNILTTAGSSLGFKHSSETKALMSKAKQDVFNGENHPMYGKNHSEVAKAKIGAAQKGRQHSEKN